jgi:hypothetical protein
MADQSTYLIQLANWLCQALIDGASIFDSFSVESFGLVLPDSILSAPAVTGALQQAQANAKKLGDGATALQTAAAAADDTKILAALVELLVAIGEFYDAISKLVSDMEANVNSATISDATALAAAESLVGELAKKLSDFFIASAITEHVPLLAFLLKLLGILDWTYQDVTPGNSLSFPFVQKNLQLDRIKDLINDPATHFQQTLGWGSPSFDPTSFFQVAKDFFAREVAVTVGVQGGEPFIKGNILIRRDSTQSPPGLLVSLQNEFDSDVTTTVPFTDQWEGGVKSTFRMSGEVSAEITPPLNFSLQPVSGQVSGEVQAFVDRLPAARPFDIVGGTGLLSISANNLQTGIGLTANWDATSGAAKIDPLVFANLTGVTLTLGSSDADGFLSSLLSNADIQGQFDLGLEWQADTGLHVTASGGVIIALPIHKQIGPIELDTIYLGLSIGSDGSLTLEASAGFTGNLGPLTASVDRMGILLDVRFASGADAKYGAFDVDLQFKPPNGVGLSIDAGMVTGGGYLYIDTARGEYAGAVSLIVADFLGVQAIGLIDTKMPDGSSGFSLLIIITASFGAGIQLGFGFTLLAVGGLLGLNRSMLLQPLMDGIRTNSIQDIMFPTNVVANATRIISDLRAIFPPQPGTFLIGPMAQIGWGEPTLVSLSMGVIIEIPPGDVAILGILKLALPADDLAILVLQVNFAGALEFDKQRLYFFASLFDSHVLFITLEGEMGVLMAWGDNSNFVVTVGGFNPQFNPPPLPFPSPKRIEVDIINESFARIRAQGYFAVTSNTVQFGTQSEFFFGFSALSVQGSSGFDALIQFSPFHFSVDISTSFSVNVFGVGMFGVDIDLTLEGPTPWHAHGTASISFFFFSVGIGIDFTWGSSQSTMLPPIAVMPIISAELQKTSNWRAALPNGSNLLVSLRQLDASDAAMVLHPVGTLHISQRAVPLDLTLDKVGNQAPSDTNFLTLDVTGGGLSKTQTLQEQFAPGQFENLDDAAKLSQASFVPMDSGIELSATGNAFATAVSITRNVRYDLTVIDTKLRKVITRFFEYPGALFVHFLGGSSMARSPLSANKQQLTHPYPDAVVVSPESFVVALQANNQAYSAAPTSFTSQAAANDYLARTVASDPTLTDTLHVLPAFEVAS